MKDQSKVIKEVFILRSIACLGIVLFNTLDTAVAHFNLTESAGSITPEVIRTIQMLLLFSTPLFVFISELILARSYKDQISNGFIKKRAKFILIPYLIMAILFSIVDVYADSSSPTLKLYLNELVKNFFLADFFGYFLLVIFQFYLLHVWFVRYVYNRFNMKTVLMVSLVINLIYLSLFNLFDLTSLPFANYYVINFLNKVPVFAWVFYFTMALYSGRNYESFIAFLNKKIKWGFVLVIFSAIAELILYHSGILDHIYSKRMDVLFYTIGVISTMLYFFNKIQKVPKILVRISQYSFGIFLLTRFVLFGVNELAPAQYSLFYLLVFIVGAFSITILGSIALTHLLNKFWWGAFIVGRIGIGVGVEDRQSSKNEFS